MLPSPIIFQNGELHFSYNFCFPLWGLTSSLMVFSSFLYRYYGTQWLGIYDEPYQVDCVKEMAWEAVCPSLLSLATSGTGRRKGVGYLVPGDGENLLVLSWFF